MANYHTIELILDFIASISWPIITLVIFFILKKPLKNLLKNIKKIGYAGTELETGLPSSQEEDKSFVEILGDGNDESYLDNALAKFSEVSINQADEIIENETKISSLDGIQNKYDRIYKYSKLLVLVKSFEKIYDSIYGSQIRLLQRLNHSNIESKASLKMYYDNANKVYPEAYKSYSYEKYLEFMKINGLVIENEDPENLQITFQGRDFLRYLVEAGSSLEKRF
ncbi:hypothetical protein [Allomuricauda sp. SCSIO 65647]|uniref:hypothetical protein n=1 Tax=Allomuricauda sp. SCSIO 65647 TaxID=2908843 RepID=UPI001F1580C8|nr:hypothetical protein [Muricauda sp. SCSIO 65647]UJH69076.1 hypothetical protein L0P89_07640 [Muricauda sp. SCSIO 65647]